MIKECDKNFINIKTINDETFTFQSTAVEITNTLTLTFPVPLPNTTVSYSFTTKGGNIQFGVNFKTLTDKQSVLASTSWCDSDQRKIEGSFQLKDPGAIYFSWDNSRQSWVSKKKLNYTIQIKQQAFTQDDIARSEKALSLLPQAREEKDIILVALGQKQESERGIEHTKELLENYQLELKALKKNKKKVVEKIGSLKGDIKFFKERIRGLSFR
jgi:outer membrane translocation and assembly module TamA